MSISENFTQAYLEAAGAVQQPDWLKDFRKKAYQQFKNQGLPTPKEEAWHYSSTRRFTEHSYKLASRIDGAQVQDAARDYSDDASDLTLLVVNGIVYAPHDAKQPGDDKIQWESLIQSSDENALRDMFAETPGFFQSVSGGFDCLHDSCIQDALDIKIAAKSSDLPTNVHIIYVAKGSDQASGQVELISPRLRVRVGDGSHVCLKETFICVDITSYFTHAILDMQLDPRSKVEHVRRHIQGDSSSFLGSSHVSLAKDACYSNLNLVISGGWLREQWQVELLDQGAHAQLDALYLGQNQQHIDFHTHIEHRAAHTTSNQLYKAVLGGKAHGVFDGKIKIHKNAQQVSANQLNRNLLVTDSARASTKPQMEIEADDVKCSHGATVGQLDQEQIFYLQSRGVSATEAQKMLAEGFVSDVMQRHPAGLVDDVFERHVKPAIPIFQPVKR